MRIVKIAFRTLVTLIVMTSFNAFATEGDQAKCIHQDGYGTYVGYGSTKHEARSAASTDCFNQQTDLFLQAKGRLPSDDEASALIDVCVNICP